MNVDIRAPLVSVIMPCYNGEKFLAGSLISLREQVFQDFELLLIDNGSTDGSVITARNLLKSAGFSFKILHESRRGVHFARNCGLLAARGQFICFLDVDDRLSVDSIKLRADMLCSQNVSLVYGCYERLNVDTGITSVVSPPLNLSLNTLLKKNYIGNLTGMYSRRELGLFLQNDIGHEDYEMWIRIMKKAKRAFCVSDSILGIYSVRADSLSANKLRASLWHYNVLKRHVRNPLKRLFYMSMYMYGSLRRYL